MKQHFNDGFYACSGAAGVSLGCGRADAAVYFTILALVLLIAKHLTKEAMAEETVDQPEKTP